MRGPVALLGQCPGMVAVREQVGRLMDALTEARRLPPVLILGETGTGKGLLAKAIHDASSRASGPFVDVGCPAIPEALLEAELFGFAGGAFTDARHPKAGLFQAAHGGTLFLDEVALMPWGLQAKVLKAVEDRVVRRLGSTRSETVDVLIIAATNEDLAAAKSRGRFREDLYHRLAGVTFRLPPLRERGADIVLLAEHFLNRACAGYGLPQARLAPDARAALLSHPWPGNVRELANLVERVALLSRQPSITADLLDLPTGSPRCGEPAPSPDLPPLRDSLSNAERAQVVQALARANGNLTRAAQSLGLPRNTLRYRIGRLGLSRDIGALAEPLDESARAHTRGNPVVGLDRAQSSGRTSPAPAPEDGDGRVTSWMHRYLTVMRTELGASGGSELRASVAVDRLVEKIEGFGGRIEQQGERVIVAVFGLEPAEDSPSRAVLAAMAIRKAGDQADGERAIATMTAIHVARARIGQRGNAVRVDRDDMRDAIAVLEGLRVSFVPNPIILSETAAVFVRRHFEVEGRAENLASQSMFCVASVAREWGAFHGRELSPLVGRTDELAALRRAADQIGQGRGRVIGVMGEPGVGKSRLIFEFLETLRASAAPIIEARCVAHGSATPYLPVSALLRRVCDIDDRDEPATVAAKLGRELEARGMRPEDAQPYLLQLLGVTDASARLQGIRPETIKARIFTLVRGLLLAPRPGELRVIIVEDLHWMDRTSEEFLGALVEGLAAEPLLLVVTYRPGFRLAWLERSHVTQIALPPLSDGDSLRVVQAASRHRALSEEAEQGIVRRAEGNPFFLEELTRMVLERGPATSTPVPDTVEGALMARIDRLPGQLKRVLQTAAVLGREFPTALLAAVWEEPESIEPHLVHLARLEFICDRTRGDQRAYAFKHALTQEVAYDSVLPTRRQALHGATARALEALYADRAEEQCEVLAYHYARSSDLEQAFRCLEGANRRAVQAYAMPEAREYFYEAMKALDALPDTDTNRDRRVALLARQAVMFLELFQLDEYQALLGRHRRLAAAVTDEALRGRFYTALGMCALFFGRLDESIEATTAAAALCQGANDADGAADAHSFLAWASVFGGDFEQALCNHGPATRGLPQTVSARCSIYILGARARAWAGLGRWRQAIADSHHCLRLAEEVADDGLITFAAHIVAGTYLLQGDSPAGVEYGEVAVRTAQTRSDDVSARSVLAWAWCRGGEPGRGLPVLEESVSFLGAAAPALALTWVPPLAEGYLAAGRWNDARRTLEQHLEAARRFRLRFYLGWAHRLLGEALLQIDPGSEEAQPAAHHFGNAMDILGAIGAEDQLARACAGYGRLLHREGDLEGGRAHLTRALEVFERLGTLIEPETVRLHLRG